MGTMEQASGARTTGIERGLTLEMPEGALMGFSGKRVEGSLKLGSLFRCRKLTPKQGRACLLALFSTLIAGNGMPRFAFSYEGAG